MSYRLPCLLIIFLLGCSSAPKKDESEKNRTTVVCTDEFSKKNNMNDTGGLGLTLSPTTDGSYEAKVIQMFFTSEHLRTLPASRKGSQFKGDDFLFKMKGKSGVMNIKLEKPIITPSHPGPRTKVKEKMVCSEAVAKS